MLACRGTLQYQKPSELFIDVPEVTETRLNQMVKDWPLGQTLLVSGGIQPGILQDKNGFLSLRIPGTVPGRRRFMKPFLS